MRREERRKHTVERDDAGRRLDRVVRRLRPDLPLSRIYRLIRRGGIRVNGSRAGPADRVREGDTIEAPEAGPSAEADGNTGAVRAPGAEGAPRSEGAWSFPLKAAILVENPDVLALNKPRGWTVHGPGSVEEVVRRYLAADQPASLSFRPGPVHRLDRNTSGALLFARSLRCSQALSAMFRKRAVRKFYLALVDGELHEPVTWRDRITRVSSRRKTVRGAPTARQATTLVHPLAVGAGRSLIVCEIPTGRTHQIRAQAALHGHPLSGDRKYGGSRASGFYLLHAFCLHTGRRVGYLGFTTLFAPVPDEMHAALPDALGPEVMGSAEPVVTALIRDGGREA